MESREKLEVLSPCPFCGSPAKILEGGYKMWCVECSNNNCSCGLGNDYSGFESEPDYVFGTKEDAIATWNKRAAPPDEPVLFKWNGKPNTELSRKELLDVMVVMRRQMRDMKIEHKRQISVLLRGKSNGMAQQG